MASSSVLDIVIVSVVVLAAVAYLLFRLRKKIHSIRDPRASSGCGCGCGCGGGNAKKKPAQKKDPLRH